MKIRASLVCLLLLSLPSCFLGAVKQGEPLPWELTQSLQPGMSAKDVVDRLGGPTEVVQLGRRFAYKYEYAVMKRTGTLMVLLNLYNEDARSDRVWCFFDEDQVLTHVGSTFQAHHAQFHFWPTSDIYDPEDAAADDAGRGIR